MTQTRTESYSTEGMVDATHPETLDVFSQILLTSTCARHRQLKASAAGGSAGILPLGDQSVQTRIGTPSRRQFLQSVSHLIKAATLMHQKRSQGNISFQQGSEFDRDSEVIRAIGDAKETRTSFLKRQMTLRRDCAFEKKPGAAGLLWLQPSGCGCREIFAACAHFER